MLSGHYTLLALTPTDGSNHAMRQYHSPPCGRKHHCSRQGRCQRRVMPNTRTASLRRSTAGRVGGLDHRRPLHEAVCSRKYERQPSLASTGRHVGTVVVSAILIVQTPRASGCSSRSSQPVNRTLRCHVGTCSQKSRFTYVPADRRMCWTSRSFDHVPSSS